MADITILNNGQAGNAQKLVPFIALVDITTMSLDLGAVTTASGNISTASSSSDSFTVDMDEIHLKTHVANNFSLAGARFRRGSTEYVVKANGDVQANPDPATGVGSVVGEISGPTGSIILSNWSAGGTSEVTNWRAAAGAPVSGGDTPYTSYLVTFRTATAPLRTGSFSLIGSMQDGTPINVTADSNGYIDATRIKGKINYTTGVVQIVGVKPSAIGGEDTVDISDLGIPGVTDVYLDAIQVETLRFNAVAYTYVPLDAEILGVDPVRLPTDGRVPIFKPGDVAVVGHTAITTPETVSNSDVIDTGRTRLSRVRVLGNDGTVIQTGYTEDLEAGTVTFTDVSGYSQPVRVEHRIEDMSLIRDAQINGSLTMLRPFTHDFPAGSSISGALLAGDMRSRVPLLFDQASWDGTTFQDFLNGAAATGTYNDTLAPIGVSNVGTINERWVLRFTSTSAFQIIGEHVGLIGTSTINEDTSPINPNTGEPYFTVLETGWGSGWATGNIVRFNTVGASFPFWIVRTIKQGPAGDHDYSFSVLLRGDVDAP